jgi:alpha-L-rhamnosidase
VRDVQLILLIQFKFYRIGRGADFMLKVKNLRCEYKQNPMGISVLKPRLSWVLSSDEKNVMQVSYHLQVSENDVSFVSLAWDSGKTDSDRSVHVEYEGQSLLSKSRYYFRVKVWDNHGNASAWSEPAFWETGILNENEWIANFITPAIEVDPASYAPSPLLRKEFKTAGNVKAARVYVTSLGLYELRLNGQRVGNDLLTPGWTSYNKRLQYQTYDVTNLLADGCNAVGAILGDGWYKGDLAGWLGHRNLYGTKTALLMQLHIWYSDGSEQIVVSDHSWKASTGPILTSEIYHGETYDARLEQAGWDKTGFDDAQWAETKTLEVPKNILTGQENVPVRRIEEIKPIAVIHTPAGETVLDMGQNMVGWVRFRVKGPSGSRVVLGHAEVLDREGNFYTENLRAAKQKIAYTLKGEGEEVFEPHFTFQGFRYVKLEEYPCEISIDNFTGVVIHSDMGKTGSFDCSDKMVNSLQHNILWGQKGNFVDVPTDCPQRDERLGWTGDAQVFIRTACFNMNAAPFFEKWLRDLKADQLASGGVPFVIPQVLTESDHSSTGWGDAAVICPWTVYLCYGDEGILKEQYESMKAWVDYIKSNAQDGLIWNSGFHFGDWLALDAKEGSYYGATPNDYVATAFYAYSVELFIKAAEVLHNDEDVKEYSLLYDNIVKAFRMEFFTPFGRLAVPTQTAHVLALNFNLVEEKHRERTVDALVKLIEDNKYHLTTGFLGTPYLCNALSKNGRIDIAYKLLMQTEYPSWLYQVTKGATTIWEHWDGIKPDGSMWSADMNSFNHYAYGAIGDWMYRVIAGIDTDDKFAGYKHIVIKPQPGGDLKYAYAELESMYGNIKSGWKTENGAMQIEVTIPHNTTASVMLPGAKASQLTDHSGLKFCDTSEGTTVELGSGSYSFMI